jgi:hypothetical protein
MIKALKSQEIFTAFCDDILESLTACVKIETYNA